MPTARARVAIGFAALALASGLVCATAALLAGPAYRSERLALGAAFELLRWATYGAMAGAAVALLAGAMLLLVRARRGRAVAAAALVLNAAIAQRVRKFLAQLAAS